MLATQRASTWPLSPCPGPYDEPLTWVLMPISMVVEWQRRQETSRTFERNRLGSDDASLHLFRLDRQFWRSSAMLPRSAQSLRAEPSSREQASDSRMGDRVNGATSDLSSANELMQEPQVLGHVGGAFAGQPKPLDFPHPLPEGMRTPSISTRSSGSLLSISGRSVSLPARSATPVQSPAAAVASSQAQQPSEFIASRVIEDDDNARPASQSPADSQDSPETLELEVKSSTCDEQNLGEQDDMTPGVQNSAIDDGQVDSVTVETKAVSHQSAEGRKRKGLPDSSVDEDQDQGPTNPVSVDKRRKTETEATALDSSLAENVSDAPSSEANTA